jgi:hypothetical protein
VFFQEAFTEEGAVPGAVFAIQSFGDFLGFNVFCGERIQPGDEKAMETWPGILCGRHSHRRARPGATHFFYCFILSMRQDLGFKQ